MAVKHAFSSGLADDAASQAAGEVLPSHWNANHTVDDNTFAAAKLSASATDVVFGRSTASAGAGEEIPCTAAGRALLDDVDAAAQRTTLGLGTAATTAASAYATAAQGTLADSAVQPTDENFEIAVEASKGYIQGLELSFSSTTAVAVAAGELNINGTLRTYAGGTLTSGSTMLDIAGNTVTIGASKAYFVFAYWNGSALVLRVEERDASGDGADPTFDTALDYWKAASTGAEARRIGKFWTNSSSQVIFFEQFLNAVRGRAYRMVRTGVNLVTNGSGSLWTSLTITPYITADDATLGLLCRPSRKVSTGVVHTFISTDGSNQMNAFQIDNQTTSFTCLLGAFDGYPNTGSLSYGVTDAVNIQTSIDLCGFSHIV